MIYLCEQCDRYFDAQQTLMAPQPETFGFLKTYGLPETFLCPLADCATIAAAKQPKPAPKAPTPQPKAKRKPSTPPTVTHHRGCHEEKDYTDRTHAVNPIPGAQMTLPHAEQVKAFVASGQAKGRDKAVYDRLNKTFDGINPGQWVLAEDLRQEIGIWAINSCASRIRDWKCMEGLDVDSKITPVHGKPYWSYRICRAEDSESIAREAAKAVADAAAAEKSKESL